LYSKTAAASLQILNLITSISSGILKFKLIING